jgi:hypothetical protein
MVASLRLGHSARSQGAWINCYHESICSQVQREDSQRKPAEEKVNSDEYADNPERLHFEPFDTEDKRSK